MKFSVPIFSFASFVSTTLASVVPLVPLQSRDVFNPKITSPTTGTVWTSGTRQNVTWETEPHPADITNKVGKILLASGGLILSGGLGSGSMPLAQDFDILSGSIEITVPSDLVTNNNYQLVLEGDSGNFGAEFLIVNQLEMCGE